MYVCTRQPSLPPLLLLRNRVVVVVVVVSEAREKTEEGIMHGRHTSESSNVERHVVGHATIKRIAWRRENNYSTNTNESNTNVALTFSFLF